MYAAHKLRRTMENRVIVLPFFCLFCDFFFSVESLRQVELSISPTTDRNLSQCSRLPLDKSVRILSFFFLLPQPLGKLNDKSLSLSLCVTHARTFFAFIVLTQEKGQEKKRKKKQSESERNKAEREFIK
jgi:hypothetical protein